MPANVQQLCQGLALTQLLLQLAVLSGGRVSAHALQMKLPASPSLQTKLVVPWHLTSCHHWCIPLKVRFGPAISISRAVESGFNI